MSYRRYRTDRLSKHAEWRTNNPTYMSERQLFRRYGLRMEDWDRLLESQNGLCAICKEPFEIGSSGKHPVVDHCHKTGKIRGLLHSNCNTGLGMFKDDVIKLRAAIEYLER